MLLRFPCSQLPFPSFVWERKALFLGQQHLEPYIQPEPQADLPAQPSSSREAPGPRGRAMGARTRCGGHPVFPVWAEITTSPSPLQPGPPSHQIPHQKGSRTRQKGEAHERQQTSRRCRKRAPGPNLFWQSVRDRNPRSLRAMRPGAWVLRKKAFRVGEPSLAEKGLGAQRKEARPGMARALLARVDDCSCPAQTSSRNQPPFYFLGGSFFFLSFFQTVNRKKF